MLRWRSFAPYDVFANVWFFLYNFSLCGADLDQMQRDRVEMWRDTIALHLVFHLQENGYRERLGMSPSSLKFDTEILQEIAAEQQRKAETWAWMYVEGKKTEKWL